VKIVVTVGSSVIPFDRLIDACGRLAGAHEVVIQCGASHLRPEGATCVDFMSFDELAAHMSSADAVVTHAGVGSVMLALANRKRPVLVPRSPALGEAVDDHQEALGRRLDGAGLATFVDDVAELEHALSAASATPPELRPTGLVDDVAVHLDAAVSARCRPLFSFGRG
jgi:UDP-N-acetylglucosamine transferase subunit ALG13